MRIRTLAGWLVILAATGLAAVSGNLAYHGFEAMLSIPFAGWIGPFVAASLIGLGIGAESEIRDGAWLPAIVLLVLLGGAAALDKHSGELALKARVEAAEQANADRKAAYTTAVAEKAAAEKVLADLDAELALLNGSDVKAIQRAIGTVPDGAWARTPRTASPSGKTRSLRHSRPHKPTAANGRRPWQKAPRSQSFPSR